MDEEHESEYRDIRGNMSHGTIHGNDRDGYVNEYGDPVEPTYRESESRPYRPEKSIFAGLASEISRDFKQEMHGYKTIYHNSGIITSILFGTVFKIMFLVFKYALIYWPLTISLFLIGFGVRDLFTMLSIHGNFFLNYGLADLSNFVVEFGLGIIILFIYYLYRKNKYK